MLTIGTLIHGTLREADLLTAFADELEHQLHGRDAPGNCGQDNQHYVDQVDEARECLDDDGEVTEDKQEAAAELVNDLMDSLNDFAPEYTHFGAHEGDGADFGCWPSWYSLKEDARCGSGVLVVDGVPSYLQDVNDHGNVTLYRVEVTEVWSIV